MSIAINTNTMQQLNSVLEAARQRNGFTGGSARQVTPQATFVSTLEKISTGKAPARMADEKVVRPAVFPKAEMPKMEAAKKPLGNFIDVMA